MRNFKNLCSIVSICFILSITSCSRDDEEDSMENACFADNFELVETVLTDFPESNIVSITFDLTNNSSSDYNINNGSPIICTNLIVTTASGEMFETIRLLTIAVLPAGVTTSINVTGNYGDNETFSDYEINLSCQ